MVLKGNVEREGGQTYFITLYCKKSYAISCLYCSAIFLNELYILQFVSERVYVGYMNIQLLNFAYIRLLNKPYANEVTLTGQNLT